jgi:GT2 family glycosyltransferase
MRLQFVEVHIIINTLPVNFRRKLHLNISLGIATAGRRDILSATILQLSKQTRLPECLYICPASPDDVDISCLETFPAPYEIVDGPRGLTHQRNALMRRAAAADLIVFFDDDFLADPCYLAETERLFMSEADVVVVTGCVLADGAGGPGLSVAEGLHILEHHQQLIGGIDLEPAYGAYGCNMSIRLPIAIDHGIEFDEKLPLYGWWEDIDFSRRLLPFGRICRSDRPKGVHLGSKTGRSPGKKLGYSQVANLVYLFSKGSISRRVAFKRIAMSVAANFWRSFFPEPWIDRRGRLMGNLTAFAHLLTGTLAPSNIENIK